MSIAYPMLPKTIHFVEDGHRLQTEPSQAPTRSITIGKDFHGRQTRFEKFEHDTIILRETAAESGQFECLHVIPNHSIKQFDIDPESGGVVFTQPSKSAPAPGKAGLDSLVAGKNK